MRFLKWIREEGAERHSYMQGWTDGAINEVSLAPWESLYVENIRRAVRRGISA